MSRVRVFADLDMDAIAHASVFTTAIMGRCISVNLTIRMSYEASFDFTLYGAPYSFTVTRWSRRGFATFAAMFFDHKARDATEFGIYEEAADGTPSFNMSTPQKLNVVTQGVKDIMRCIDLILTMYQRSVLDYAVWYREKHPSTETYVDFITVYACHCIVQAHFLAPNITWELVKFSY